MCKTSKPFFDLFALNPICCRMERL